MATRRTSRIDRRISEEAEQDLYLAGVRRFTGEWLRRIGRSADDRDHGEGEQHQGQVAMAAVRGSAFGAIEPARVAGGVKTGLERPAMAVDRRQRFEGCGRWTPGSEEGEIEIGGMTTDQQTARPRALIGAVEFLGERDRPIRDSTDACGRGPPAPSGLPTGVIDHPVGRTPEFTEATCGGRGRQPIGDCCRIETRELLPTPKYVAPVPARTAGGVAVRDRQHRQEEAGIAQRPSGSLNEGPTQERSQWTCG